MCQLVTVLVATVGMTRGYIKHAKTKVRFEVCRLSVRAV